jgi:hypothetical protein
MDSHLRHMNRISNSIPPYMKKKLNNMPCNKGYIYRDIWFFGLNKKDRDNNIILFEKTRNFMLVHKISNGRHDVFKKDYITNKQTFVKSIPSLL